MGRGALTLFRLRGIRVGVDYSWFFVLFLVIFWLSNLFETALGVDDSSALPYVLAVASALAFFASILLHELGHALVAIRHGIGISEITLWLFGGVARMTRDTDSAATEFKVAIAGPLVTLAIAAAGAAVGIALAGSREGFLEALTLQENADVTGVEYAIAWLTSVNALVLIFNLIPAFPLDGGRIARATAWAVTGNRTSATRFAGTLGQIFSYVFIGAGLLLVLNDAVFSGIWLAVIGFLLGSAARNATAETRVTQRLEGLRVADVMDDEPVAIPDDATVERALDEFFLRYRWPWFPVTDEAHRFRGLLIRESADAVPEPERRTQRVRDVYEPDVSGTLQVSADAPLEALLGNEALRRLGGLVAVDRDGRLLGVVTIQHLGRALRDAGAVRAR
jgi:Zn-dependent protease